jgi:hypothetical protein
MPLQIEYKCPDCLRTVAWVYDDEADEMRVDQVTGCPGSDCTRVHEAKVRRVDEEEATKIEEQGYVR